MIEMVYRGTSKDGKGKERTGLPKNIRQIGDAGSDKRVYIEDYVITFLEKTGCAVLLGEVWQNENMKCLFADGAVEIAEGEPNDDMWEKIYREMKQYFPGREVIGWAKKMEEPEEEPDEKIDWVQVILILLVIGICVLLLVMIAFLMWVLIQRHKSRVLKRKFDDENAREAVRAMFEYTMNILAAAGLNIRNTSLYRYEKQIAKMFDEETAAEYHHIVDIRQEAVYSSNEMTPEQKAQMMAFKEKIWKRIYTNGTLIQKLQLKYIYFL